MFSVLNAGREKEKGRPALCLTSERCLCDQQASRLARHEVQAKAHYYLIPSPSPNAAVGPGGGREMRKAVLSCGALRCF
jgi:hypothetical protein